MGDDYSDGGYMGGHGGGGAGYSPGLAEGGTSPPKKMRANQSLTPVTIKQIMDASQSLPDETFRIDGREVNQLTFVGVIRNVMSNATNIIYQVEDGTSMVEAKEWIGNSQGVDEDFLAQRRSARREGVYVRVVGLLKAFQGKRSISVFHMRPVEDFNEITHHFLEAIHAHLYNTRGAMGHAGAIKSTTAPHQQQQHHQQQQQHQQEGAGGEEGLPLAQLVLNLLMEHGTEGGLSVDTIADHFSNVATYNEVKGAIDWLSQEARIYATKDESHFAATES